MKKFWGHFFTNFVGWRPEGHTLSLSKPTVGLHTMVTLRGTPQTLNSTSCTTAVATMASTRLFGVGSYIQVAPQRRYGSKDSQGGKGYVQSVTQTPGGSVSSVSVKYVVSNSYSPNIAMDRVSTTTLATFGRNRTGDENAVVESLLSLAGNTRTPAGRRGQARRSLPLSTARRRSPPGGYTTNDLLRMMNNPNTSPTFALGYLDRARNTKPFGWLRVAEAKAAGRDEPALKSHFSETEKKLIFQLNILLKGSVNCVDSNVAQPTTVLLARAWGKTDRCIQKIYTKATKEQGESNLRRKEREDKGSNVFESLKKQKSEFTGLNIYKKRCGDTLPALLLTATPRQRKSPSPKLAMP